MVLNINDDMFEKVTLEVNGKSESQIKNENFRRELKRLKCIRKVCKKGIRECIIENNLIDGKFRGYVNRLDEIQEKIEIVESILNQTSLSDESLEVESS